jgi:hypothetical protein
VSLLAKTFWVISNYVKGWIIKGQEQNNKDKDIPLKEYNSSNLSLTRATVLVLNEISILV